MNGPLISALCPSRGRHTMLERSIRSLRDMAEDPSRIEVCVAADPDDIPSEVAGIDLLYVTPHRYGYGESNRYYNELAERAAAPWHLLWNDDAEMMTSGWDRVIAKAPEGMVLWPYCPEEVGQNSFPIWPASWAKLLGHVSLTPSNDMWMTELGVITTRLRHVPIVISHCKVMDTLFTDRMAAESVDGGFLVKFYGDAMKLSRERDAEIIIDAFQDAPGNEDLVSVVLPSWDHPVIQSLQDLATRPSDTQYLVAAGSDHPTVRRALEDQNVMGLTEVHSMPPERFRALREHARGGRSVDSGSFTIEPGWDEVVRKGA